MANWKATLIFEDKINNRKQDLQFNFPPLYNYHKLYDNLKVIFKCIGWERLEFERHKVDFKILTYRDDPIDVNDWNIYILNRDEVKIVIFDPNKIYYTLCTDHEIDLMTTSNLTTIYDDLNIELLKEVLKIYAVTESGTRLGLVDVIVNPRMLYNRVVNRMIHNYYEPYHIAL